MALTNAHWGTPINPVIAQAALDAPPLMAGSTGAAVLLVRKALERLGFERGLDKYEVFGPYTATIVTDFQDLYNLPKTGIVGRVTLEAMDKLLNGVALPQNLSRVSFATGSEVGAVFARQHLPETKRWIQKAILELGTAYKEYWMGNEVSTSTAMALLYHFRIVTTSFTDIYSSSLGFNPRNIHWRFLDGTKTDNRFKVVMRLQEIKQRYQAMLDNLVRLNGSNFLTYVIPAPPAADPQRNNLAWADVPNGKIYFHPNLFFAKTSTTSGGKDVKSASWIVVHELGHLIIGEDSFHTYAEGTKLPMNNSYSSNSQYYADGADQCAKNPDSYAHFAYQIMFGKPNVGPY